jgi:hypothetical protein
VWSGGILPTLRKTVSPPSSESMGKLSEKRVTQALLATCFMLVSGLAYSLRFDPEDGSDTVFRSVG